MFLTTAEEKQLVMYKRIVMYNRTSIRLSADFSAETLKQLDFSENTWNLDNCSYDNLPSLNNSDPRNTSSTKMISRFLYV